MKTLPIWLLLLSIPVYGFFVHPNLDEVKTKKAFNEKLTEKRDDRRAEHKEILKKREGLGDLPDSLLVEMPIKMHQESVIRDLEQLSRKTKFNFTSLGFSKGVNNTLGIPQMTVSFSVEGPAQYALGFLKAIEENKRFMGMDRLQYSTSENNGIPVATFSVSLYTFFLEG